MATTSDSNKTGGRWFEMRGKKENQNPAPDGLLLDDGGDEDNILYSIPFVNVFYFILFDRTPAFDDVRNILDTMGLAMALLLSIAMAIPMSISWDDYQNIIDMYDADSGTPYASCGWSGYDIINQFNSQVSTAVFFNAAGILIVITLVVFTVVLDTSRMSVLAEYEFRTLWWRYVRFPVGGCLIIGIIGICATFSSYLTFTQLTMPNQHIEESGCWTDSNSEGPWIYSNPWGFNMSMYLCVSFLSLFVVFSCLSYATHKLTKERKRLENVSKAHNSTKK